MYTKEQEEIALKAYEQLGSVHAVIRRLGYPSESTLYSWYERRNAGVENRHGHAAEIPEKSDHKCNTPDHPRHPSAEFKYEVLRRCFELGEDVICIESNRIQPYEHIYMAKKILEVRDGWPYGKEKRYSKKTVASGISKAPL